MAKKCAKTSRAGVFPGFANALRDQRNVDAVLVDLRVVDRDGRFVRGLSREDFIVSEDGEAQTVASFALVELEHYRKPTRERSTSTFRTSPRVR